MSKELEALKNIVNEISNYKLHGLGDENWLGIQDIMQDIDILEKALTPPTEQEVCEALGEYMNEPVWLDDNGNIRITQQWIVKKIYLNGKYVGLDIQVILPPHLVEMIGKFYKGKVKENE